MALDPSSTWSPPIYDLSTKPELSSTYTVKDQSHSHNQIFARSAKWTPDGSVFMAHCEDRTLQLFNASFSPSTPSPACHSPTAVFQQPAPILDFTWYPTASPHDPASFCFLASIRECPVKLLDASDGRLRASYKIVDHRERFIAPHCMSFNPDASRLYCGYEDAIEVFDISRPGEGTRIPTTPSRKSKDGLKGIVSALAFSPIYTTSSDTFYAAGTLSSTSSNLALYSESQGDIPLMFLGGGLRSGVTQVRFNPTRPHILYAAYRRRNVILEWDVRSDLSTPLVRYTTRSPHTQMTNQKMGFDLNMWEGSRLALGDQTGSISVFDLNSPGSSGSVGEGRAEAEADDVKYPDLVFDAHTDSVGSVAFHPYTSTLLSVSGSRHYEDLAASSPLEGDSGSGSETSSAEDEGEDEGGDRDTVRIQLRHRLQPTTTDSSIKLWDFRR